MAMPVKVMSSTIAPSTDSSAKPWQLSKTQLEMVMFLKPPLDSVPSLMRPVPTRPFGISIALPGAVEHGAKLVDAGDVAVGDGEVLCGARVAECKGALGADAVVPRRVDGAVGDADVAAAVDVDAVAVGVDLEVVDGEVVDAGGEDAEPSALEDGEVAKDDVAAVLERDGLVADAGSGGVGQRLLVVAAAETFAPDEAGAEDAEVVDVLAPDEAVVPVIVAVVLIGLPRALRLGSVVAAAGEAFVRCGRGENGGALLKEESDVALEMDGVAGK